jgi:hypothetical protein
MSSSHPAVLRDLRMYIVANGKNESMFPSHIYTYLITNEEGKEVYTNLKEPAVIEQGPVGLGYHKAIIDWLHRKWLDAVTDILDGENKSDNGRGAMAVLEELRAARTVTLVVSPGDQLLSAYRQTPEQLVANGFRQKDGELRGNAAWVAHALVKAEVIGATVTCRDTRDTTERVTLSQLRRDGRLRWQAAQQSARISFA